MTDRRQKRQPARRKKTRGGFARRLIGLLIAAVLVIGIGGFLWLRKRK